MSAAVLAAAGWFIVSAGCVEELDVLAAGGRADAGSDAGHRPPSELPDPILLYRFDEGAGDRVLDSSPVSPLVHLRIQSPANVAWADGALHIVGPTVIASEAPAMKVFDACTASNALSVEAWIRPRDAVVDGTRRVITFSAGPNHRNFTLGQGALEAEPAIDAWVLRVRTTESGANGLPMLSTGAGGARTELTHVVAIHAPGGSETLFVDQRLAAAGTRAGSFASWSPDYRLALADELEVTGDDRAWHGELHHLAVYCVALSNAQVLAAYAAGPPGGATTR